MIALIQLPPGAFVPAGVRVFEDGGRVFLTREVSEGGPNVSTKRGTPVRFFDSVEAARAAVEES